MKQNHLLFNGGYVTFGKADTSEQTYHYFSTDHQGNVRAVYDEKGDIEQSIAYDPFGVIIPDLSTGTDIQPYLYNGKELDRVHGLNWYDYGARMYDVTLGRWTSIDPLCEKYYHVSPYAYCGNNPVNRIDPDGKRDYKVNLMGLFYESTSIWEQIKSAIGFGSNLDRIYMEGNNKPFATYPEGTIEDLENKNGYTSFHIKNEKYANDLFQQLIRRTDVEWSNARLEKGNNKFNLIMNTHSDGNVEIKITPFYNYIEHGFSLRLFEHSHPIPADIKNGDPIYIMNSHHLPKISNMRKIIQMQK